MFGTQGASLDLQRLPIQLAGLAELALRSKHISQVVHRTQRVGMLWAQDAALDLQRLLIQLAGLLRLAEMVEKVGEKAYRTQRVRMLWAQEAEVQVVGPGAVAQSDVVLTQGVESDRQC